MIKKLFFSVIVGGVVLFGLTMPAIAVSCPAGSVRSTANSLVECNTEKDPGNDSLMKTIKNIINVIIGIVGIISVVMIIVGGIAFATSSGDQQKTKKGKDTVLFAVIGLVVAILAFAIVNFVLDSVF